MKGYVPTSFVSIILINSAENGLLLDAFNYDKRKTNLYYSQK